MAQNIFVCAGDVSGDIHAARLVRELKAFSHDCRVTALGGRNLEGCSDEFLANLVDLSAFGFWAPLRLYFRLSKIFKHRIKSNWDRERPAKVVLVDYYGFNIHLAREARRRGIPVYYYISPQVWATRAGRIRKIARYVNKMLVILPFEEELYRRAGIDAVFVGHPLLDIVPAMTVTDTDQSRPVIGLFPGSRPNVFKKHMPILLEAAADIRKRIPSADFRIVGVSSLGEKLGGLPYPVIAENDFAGRAECSLAITTSGTVSLENALLGLPMIVFYRLSRFNYFLAERLVKIPYITMVNILLNEPLVPEMIQDESAPGKLAAQAVRLLDDRKRLEAMKKGFQRVREMLGTPGASRRAAEIIHAG